MLHEILLSLSGHSSPLLRPDAASSHVTPGHGPTGAQRDAAESALSPSELALLSDLARLSQLHIRLRIHAAHIAAVHPSVVCRAVAAAIVSVHLAAFQRDVLAIEETVLKRDPMLVGAYDIVPLTAVVGAFADWPRRFEWLWTVAQYILPEADIGAPATTKQPKATVKAAPAMPSGAQLINHLRRELQTGYIDIERTARSLVRVAETAWLKQVSAWILYGRLPSFGGDDFFVQQEASTADTTGKYVCASQHLPDFVAPATAASMLFIGRSLVHLRAKTHSRGSNGPKASHWLGDGADGASSEAAASSGDYHLSAQLQELSRLSYPLDGVAFSRTIAHIRAVLSRTALRKLLPPAKVVGMLQLLRDFFLLGRGEFAMALVEQADETMRSRWQRSDGAGAAPPTTAGGVRSMKALIVKDGEVAAVLSRTWAVLGAMHGHNTNADLGEEEDEGLELAREILRLVLQKSTTSAASSAAILQPDSSSVASGLVGGRHGQASLESIAATPFQNLLFSVPASLVLQIPYPLDLVLSATDLQMYSAIHAYLLSIRRAHLRLTGLWKLSSLRRHHPPPPGPPYGGRGSHSLKQAQMLRERYTMRADTLRSMWATASAAIFFLAEMENYLQTDIVVELWEGFQQWLTVGKDAPTRQTGLGDASLRKASQRDRNADDHNDAIMVGLDKEDFGDGDSDSDDDNDIWLDESLGREDDFNVTIDDTSTASHDPQSLATAHRQYLRRLVRRLLLDRPQWTDPLYALLVSIDQMTALVHRLQALWQALDLESDVGVVDAFVDLEREQQDVLDALSLVERSVRGGVLSVVDVLRNLEGEEDGRGQEDDEDDEEGDEDYAFSGDSRPRQGLRAAGAYVPRRVGRVDRLLMKLDFGNW
ncbi:MAG: hypothetical protein SEPTF4163_006307 [Sporothrix epigloea]